MAKKSAILLLVAALFAVVLVGILFFTPCGVTIEKFQNVITPIPDGHRPDYVAPTVGTPPMPQGPSAPAQAIPRDLLPAQRGPPSLFQEQLSRQAQPIPQVAPSVSGTVTPQGPTIAPVSADCTPGGNTYGYPSNDNTIRLYATEGCKALNGILSPNGECMRQEGGSFSWDCRGLNPVPAAEQCNTLYPPPPPTLAQCSSQYSCQTTLAPIGSSMIMPSRSTPAPIA